MTAITIPIIALPQHRLPEPLQHIPQAPKHLYIQCKDWRALATTPRVALVGSRRISPYGKAVTEQFSQEFARAGVTTVSGLAIGTDSLVHRTTLTAGGATIAVLPGGLHQIYPRHNLDLADAIVQQGGALISEYDHAYVPQKWTFVERNRIVSGLAAALIVIEAAEKSGTLHTAAFALDQGIPVFAVPGAITSPTSKGTNRLIQMGAIPAISVADILTHLGLVTAKTTAAKAPDHPILQALSRGIQDGHELLQDTGMDVQRFNQELTILEIQGHIRPLGGNQWRLGT